MGVQALTHPSPQRPKTHFYKTLARRQVLKINAGPGEGRLLKAQTMPPLISLPSPWAALQTQDQPSKAETQSPSAQPSLSPLCPHRGRGFASWLSQPLLFRLDTPSFLLLTKGSQGHLPFPTFLSTGLFLGLFGSPTSCRHPRLKHHLCGTHPAPQPLSSPPS